MSRTASAGRRTIRPSSSIPTSTASRITTASTPTTPSTKTIGFYYTNSEGELTIGTATPDPDGKTLHQDFDIMHPDGKTGHIRSTLVRDGNDAYWFSVFMQKNGEWAQVFKIRYERK